VAPIHRAALADLAFRDLPGVRVDLTDLDEGRFADPATLALRHAAAGEIWHVVGADLVTRGREGRSAIQTRWENGASLWERSRFVILQQPDEPAEEGDLPPAHRTIRIDGNPRYADIRSRLYAGASVIEELSPEVAAYISRHRLFVPFTGDRSLRLHVTRPRVMTVFDERNARAAEIAQRYQRFVGGPPDIILVIGGDGTMLHAIRRHWRLRVPFLGLNTGHFGFLMNERLPHDLEELELVTYAVPMLRVDTEAPDGRPTSGLAYSDAWLERDSGQAVWLRLAVDGQDRVPKIVGDGVLVATPSGSSAYARAMGAVPVPLNAPVLTLAGSNVFTPRFWRPMTLTDDSVVTLTSLDRSGKRPVRGFIDGQPMGLVRTMTLRQSAVAGAELAFTREFDPTDRLLRSLFPPSDEGD
jgi:NAD kinase